MSQRSSQAQGKAQEPHSSRALVLTRKATLEVCTTRSPLLSLEKIPRNHRGFAALPGDRTTHPRRHRGRRGARHQRQRQRSALLLECHTTRLRKQRRTRLHILLDEMSWRGHFPGSNSYLELRSVSGPTRDKYRAATQSYLRWADKMKVPLASESELDAGLAQWMNMRYAEGHRAWQGERVVAGLLFFLSEHGKAGNKSIPPWPWRRPGLDTLCCRSRCYCRQSASYAPQRL